LNSFSTVYLAGGMIFAVAAIGSLLAREGETK
jgi:hypothetical protein